MQTYNYPDLHFAEPFGPVELSVKNTSPGNVLLTKIRVLDRGEKTLDEGFRSYLGDADELKGKMIVVACSVENEDEAVDQIGVEFVVNGKVVLSHARPKSEDHHQLVFFKMYNN